MSKLYKLIKNNDQTAMVDYFHINLSHQEIADIGKELEDWTGDYSEFLNGFRQAWALYIDTALVIYPNLANDVTFKSYRDEMKQVATYPEKLYAYRFILGLVTRWATGRADVEKGLPELNWSEPVRAFSRERDRYVIKADTEHGELELYYNERLGTYYGSHNHYFWEAHADDLEQAKQMVVGTFLHFIVK